MVNGEQQLPDGWAAKRLIDVGRLLRGVSYRKEDSTETPKKGFVPILRATNIQDEKLILDDELVYVPSDYIKPEQYLKPNDIVVCMSSGSKHLVGKTAQLAQEWKGSFGTFCATIRPTETVNSKFVGYFFSSPYYRDFIREKSAGININNLKPTDFETIEIPIPPLPEQERIVAKIEELFTQLEAGASALERVQAGLRRYKASVLKAAVEGKLGIQKANKEIQKANLAFRKAKAGIGEGELPEGWRWVKWGDLISLAQNGFGKRRSDSGKPTIVLRLADIVDKNISLENVRRIGATDDEINKYELLKNDMICIRVNGSLDNVGRMVLFRSANETITFCDHFIRFRLNEPGDQYGLRR